MLLQDTLIHLGLTLPIPFESAAAVPRGAGLARFKANPEYAHELNRFHATLKVARNVVEEQKRDETMAVPAQGLRDILSKIQELEDEVSAMLGSKSTHGTEGEAQGKSAGDSAKKPDTSPDQQYGPGGQGVPLSHPPGKEELPGSQAAGSNPAVPSSSAAPTTASSAKSADNDDCAPEHLIYALGGGSLQTRSHVSNHPLFRRSTNCTLDSIADHAQRLHKGSPLKNPASGQTDEGDSDSTSAAGSPPDEASSGQAQDGGSSAAPSYPPSGSPTELEQSKPSTNPNAVPDGVPDVTPVPLDGSTSAPTDPDPESDTAAAQPDADTGAPSSVPVDTDATLDGVDLPVSTVGVLPSSAGVMEGTTDAAAVTTSPVSGTPPGSSGLSTITLTSTRKSTKTVTITQTSTVRISRASASANAKNQDSAAASASAVTYEKFKNGTVAAKFSNGTFAALPAAKFDNSSAIPELESADGTPPPSMTEALKPSQIAVDGPLYNVTDTASMMSVDDVTSPVTPTPMKMLQTSSEALVNTTGSTSSPSAKGAKTTSASIKDSKATEKVKPISDDAVLQSADVATPSPTPEASNTPKASKASAHERLNNGTVSTSIGERKSPTPSASESSSPKQSKTSALQRLVNDKQSTSLHSIDDATPTGTPEVKKVSPTPKDTKAQQTSATAHVKAATHGSSKTSDIGAKSPASGATTSLNTPTSSAVSSLPKTPASVSQGKAFSNITTKSYPPVDEVIHPPASLQGHLRMKHHPEVTPVPLSKNPRHVLNNADKMTGPSGFKTVTNRRARN